MSDTVIATISKSSRARICIRLTVFNGHNLCDIREMAAQENGGDPLFTKKGLCVRPKLLPALIEALQAALVEAEKQGLLVDTPQRRAA